MSSFSCITSIQKHSTAAVFNWNSWVLRYLKNHTMNYNIISMFGLQNSMIFHEFNHLQKAIYQLQCMPQVLQTNTVCKLVDLEIAESVFYGADMCSPSMTGTFTESPDGWNSHLNPDDTGPPVPAGRGPSQPLLIEEKHVTTLGSAHLHTEFHLTHAHKVNSINHKNKACADTKE